MAVDIEQVYLTCFPQIYNYFFYRLLHRETAEDLTSRTFLRMIERLSTYDAARGDVEPWLFRIADRILIDYYREGEPSFSLDAGLTAEPSVTFEEEYRQIMEPHRKALYRALTQLSERDRILLYRKYLLGESYHKIAGELHMNESTLASALLRAKEKLKRQIEREETDMI